MAYGRGSAADFDAWEELGNPGWGWDGLLPYFKKSTTFQPSRPPTVEQWNITWDPSVYSHGPLHASIDDFIYPDLQSFWDAWNAQEGVERRRDFNNGRGPGVGWADSTVDRSSGVRDTSRRAYYDPVCAKRKNLHILTRQTVSEILFHDLNARGVKIVSRTSNKTREVYAKKEGEYFQFGGFVPNPVHLWMGNTIKKQVAETMLILLFN